jgi:hypothetical protein
LGADDFEEVALNRRHFLALASGLLAPVPEPVKRYFFAPAGGWRRPIHLDFLSRPAVREVESVREYGQIAEVLEAFRRRGLLVIPPTESFFPRALVD